MAACMQAPHCAPSGPFCTCPAGHLVCPSDPLDLPALPLTGCVDRLFICMGPTPHIICPALGLPRIIFALHLHSTCSEILTRLRTIMVCVTRCPADFMIQGGDFDRQVGPPSSPYSPSPQCLSPFAMPHDDVSTLERVLRGPPASPAGHNSPQCTLSMLHASVSMQHSFPATLMSSWCLGCAVQGFSPAQAGGGAHGAHSCA